MREFFKRNKIVIIVTVSILILFFLFILSKSISSSSLYELKKIDLRDNITKSKIIDNKSLKTENPAFIYQRFQNISYDGFAYKEDEYNDFIVVSFRDNSGYLNEKNIRLIVRNFKEDIIICEESNDEVNPQIYCNISPYLKNRYDGILILSYYVTGGGGIYYLGWEEITDELRELILNNAKDKCDNGIQEYCINY